MGKTMPIVLKAIATVVLVFVLASPVAAVEVERVVSPGGIEAWLVRDNSVPITAIEFSFRGGGGLDPAGKAGLADMTMSLLDEGAGDLDSQAFQGRAESLSIRLSFNAGLETVRGSLKTLNRNRAVAFELLGLALAAPRFDADAVQRIRQQISVSLRRRSSDPNSVASLTWRRAVFAGHPYGRPVGGTVESIAGLTIDDMRAFIATRFTRENLIIGVVGDITAKALGPILDQVFGALPVGAPPRARLADATLRFVGETFVVEMDNPQSVVVFGQAGLARDHRDYYAAYIMNHILGGGGFSSRLYQEVREKRGLAYSVYSYLNPARRGALISGGVATRNDQVAKTLSVIRNEWRRMRENGVSAEELADAKTYLNGSYPLRLSSTSRIARMLVGMQYNTLGRDYLERRADMINAVTMADIKRVAETLLDSDRLTVVIAGKPKDIVASAKAPEIGN
jgi:zinc protease